MSNHHSYSYHSFIHFVDGMCVSMAEFKRAAYTSCEFQRLAKLAAVPVITICVTIVTCIAILMYYLSLGPKLPTLHVNSISVSNFTTTNTCLVANWDVNMTFKNSNKLWETHMDYIHSILFYEEEFSLAWNDSMMGFKLNTRDEKTMNVKLVAGDHFFSTQNMLNNVSEDWRNGMVRFDLSIRAKTRFEGGVTWLWWTQGATLVYSCLDLKVGFKDPNDKSVGTLIGQLPRQC